MSALETMKRRDVGLAAAVCVVSMLVGVGVHADIANTAAVTWPEPVPSTELGACHVAMTLLRLQHKAIRRGFTNTAGDASIIAALRDGLDLDDALREAQALAGVAADVSADEQLVTCPDVHSAVLNNAAVIEWLVGRVYESIDLFEAALQVDPMDDIVMRNLAWLWQTRNVSAPTFPAVI